MDKAKKQTKLLMDVSDGEESESIVSEESVSESSRKSSPTPRKRRGRPPTTGHYIGLAKAKLALIEAEREAEERRAEAEVVAASRVVRSRAESRRVSESPSNVEEFKAAGSLSQVIEDNVGIIRKVASTSKNLKGGYVRALKDAADEIAKVALSLQNRCTTEETKGLQADNARLQAEVTQLRKEVAEMRERLLKPTSQVEAIAPRQPEPQPQANEDLVRTILCQVGTMISARFEALEDRLLPEKRLRPPLAGDSRPKDAGPSVQEAPKPQRLKKSGQSKSKVAPTEKAVEPQPQPTEAQSAGQPLPEQPWNVVVRKGLKKKTQNTSKVTSNKERVAKLSPPKSAAVVVTLTPEAIEKGVKYDTIIAEAKARIKLQDLGITGGVRFRVCATGARRFEVMGTDNSSQADALAEKLVQVLDRDMVRVSRPVKTTEVKVSGLDDSISIEEVLDAIAEAGDCPKASLKSSGVVKDTFGVGHAWIECPVTAAKRVAEAGRLTLSWVSASIKLLEPRPLRCFRCLQKGHVKAQCGADVDRSQECFRCGKEGHKSRDCSAKPHCSICAAAKKPADHQLGGKACSAPAPKMTRLKDKPQARPARQQQETAMETDQLTQSNGS